MSPLDHKISSQLKQYLLMKAIADFAELLSDT